MGKAGWIAIYHHQDVKFCILSEKELQIFNLAKDSDAFNYALYLHKDT